MTNKIPIRTVFDSSNNAIGLSEFQNDEKIGYQYGGTGLSSLGTAGQVLTVNSGRTALEYTDKTQVDLSPYLQAANASALYVTKSDSVSSNNALKLLIDDRIQVANVTAIQNTLQSSIDTKISVANVVATYATISTVNANLANTNAYIAATQSNIDTLEATVNSNLANTNTYIATKLDTSTASATYVTKTDAVSSNNTLNSLIDDRLQVANAASIYQTIANERAALANTNNRLNTLEAGGTLATNTYIVANYLQKTSSGTQSTAGEIRVDSSDSTSGVHIKDGSIVIFSGTGSPAFMDFYCEVSNAHRTRLKSAAHSDYSGNSDITLPTTSGTLALIASPTFTGTPAAPTAAGGTNTTQIATTAFVRGEVSGLVDSAPASLDTLNELAAALGDDANFSTTVTNLIGTKLAVSNANLTIAADSGTNDVVSIVTDVLTIAGDTGITTTVSDNQISIDLDDTAVTPGSYGNTTAIPVVTVDQQGRLTAATTAAISSSLTIAADSGDDDTVTVGTDTLTFAGTTNEIDTTVTNNQIQIGLVASPQVTGLTATGTIAAANFNSTSDQRLKKNIEDSAGSSEIIDNIKVRQFDWIENDKHQQYGFVAQELVEVFPDAVVKGLQDDDIWRIDYNQVVPLLVKEIQQLRARIEKLESN